MVAIKQVTTLKREATKLLAEIRRSRKSILITERGLPSAYLIDVKSYEALQSRMTILEGLARGEADLRAGRTLTHDQVKKKMAKWLK